MPSHPLLAKFKLIKAFVLDVDGTLTDGTVAIHPMYTEIRSYGIRDGYAMKAAAKAGFIIIIISGSGDEVVRARMNKLDVTEVHVKIPDKKELLITLMAKHGLSAEQVLYMGDDIPDLEAMKICGLKTCPADSVIDILETAEYVSPYNGGKGCVRDVIEKAMRLQGKWTF